MKHLFEDKHQIKITKALLKSAKKRLKDGANTAVCSAVIDSRGVRIPGSWVEQIGVIDIITDEISHRLGSSSYVTDWLEREHGITLSSYGERTKYRRAWIDNILKELA
jgi:hypothetical protein